MVPTPSWLNGAREHVVVDWCASAEQYQDLLPSAASGIQCDLEDLRALGSSFNCLNSAFPQSPSWRFCRLGRQENSSFLHHTIPPQADPSGTLIPGNDVRTPHMGGGRASAAKQAQDLRSTNSDPLRPDWIPHARFGPVPCFDHIFGGDAPGNNWLTRAPRSFK